LAALEAVVRGIPVVCPKSGGLSETLGDYAYYYAETGFEGFKSAMTRWIYSSEDERNAICAAAYRHYEQQLTDMHMARAYAKIYGEMIAAS
jgi:glycosyltransferase involved in cell wall biosynthesis